MFNLIGRHFVLQVLLVAVKKELADDLTECNVIGQRLSEMGFPLLKLYDVASLESLIG